MELRLTALIVALGLSLWCEGQNLAPNPSFETFTNCPTAQSQINRATPWDRPPGAITTPDYFNSCHTTGSGCTYVGVPPNLAGTAPANTGVAYSGIISYYTGCGNCREYVQAALTSSMLAGQTYLVECYVRLGDFCKYATNRIGIYISTGTVNQPGNQPIVLTPQVEHPSVIIDTANWTLVTGTYTATGGEDYVTIGNFYNNASVTVQTMNFVGGSCALSTAGAFYYIDDVTVELVSNTLTVTGDTLICLGDSATLVASGDTIYQWADSTNPTVIIDNDSILVVSPTTTTTYLVYGSSDTVSFTVTVVYPPTVTLPNDTTLCEGDSLLLDAGNSGLLFFWSTGATTQTINVSNSGTYWVEVTDSNGCTGMDTINVNFNIGPNPIVIVTDITCNGAANGSIIMNTSTGTPPFLYSIDNGTNFQSNNTFTGLGSGTYDLVLQDSLGCEWDSTVTITEPPAIILTTIAVTAECGQATGEVTVVASGGTPGYTYIWSTGCTDDQCTGLLSGTYTVTVTDSNGCTEITTVNVGETNDITVTSNPVDIACPGECDGAIMLFVSSGTPPFTYSWNTGETTVDIDSLCIGNYDVTVTDANGCTGVVTTSINIANQEPLANFAIDPNPTNIRNTLIHFYDNSTGNIIQWSWTFFDNDGSTILGGSNEQNPMFEFPQDTGTYCVELLVTTDAGCQDDTLQCLFIDGIFNVFVPNAFTPNGDGINDYFYPIGIGLDKEDYLFYIFDRWGELIFISEHPDDKWDGTARAKGGKELVQQEVYVWKLKLKEATRKNTPHEFIGHVTVVR